ncbi:hypothetical protein D917_05694 [Trichinella nativa]|uniref:Uncharacterized protein n=1 Tax=Trichinella nativa TaxID=6335 RepID=A0A1Y3EZA6_9BILA|nr:hypothetical protein D917_05694 [Trichinella nativa]
MVSFGHVSNFSGSGFGAPGSAPSFVVGIMCKVLTLITSCHVELVLLNKWQLKWDLKTARKHFERLRHGCV